jgi:hypothetical protein
MAAIIQTKRKLPRKVMWDCGTPFEHCTASRQAVSTQNGNYPYKAHSDEASARKCNKKYCAMRSAEGNGVLIPNKARPIKCSKGKVLIPPKVRG